MLEFRKNQLDGGFDADEGCEMRELGGRGVRSCDMSWSTSVKNR